MREEYRQEILALSALGTLKKLEWRLFSNCSDHDLLESLHDLIGALYILGEKGEI